jgi:alkanesulfonate monooxygenase SsuD/methylene tetrahydromethanopterin reductase-like flavin-dependent oxidoreductase (luciferase family)
MRWQDAAPRWSRAEDLAFDHAWTYDHLSWRSLRDGPWFGAVSTLVAAALTTTRIRIGPLVASPNYRHPVPFAKELLTVDDLSGGRLTLGLGAGGTGWDATVLGNDPWPRAQRTARFEEFVQLTDELLRNPVTSTRGKFYSANEARMIPGCVQRPRIPFAIAATGSRGMRLVAQYADTWVTTGARSTEEPQPVPASRGAAIVGHQIERLEDACAQIGRDPSTISRLVVSGVDLDSGLSSPDAFQDVVGHYESVGVTDLVVHWPRADGPFAADLATFEQIFAR